MTHRVDAHQNQVQCHDASQLLILLRFQHALQQRRLFHCAAHRAVGLHPLCGLLDVLHADPVGWLRFSILHSRVSSATYLTKKSMLFTYFVQIGVGKYLQKGIFSSSTATFLSACFAALINCWGSESSVRLGSRQPNLVSRATLPIHSRDHLCISLSKSSGSSILTSLNCSQRTRKSSVTCSMGSQYRRTVDNCRTGFCTRDRNSLQGSP